MRTNIDIDDALLDRAMRAGPYKTKKEAVEAGLKLLGRQAAYHEILKWRGKLNWEGDESTDWTAAAAAAAAAAVDPAERAERAERAEAAGAATVRKSTKSAPVAQSNRAGGPTAGKRRAGR